MFFFFYIEQLSVNLQLIWKIKRKLNLFVRSIYLTHSGVRARSITVI